MPPPVRRPHPPSKASRTSSTPPSTKGRDWSRARKAAYAKIAARFLADGWIVYLFHPQILIAYIDRLEGFTQRPDGLVRVIGLKLK